MYVLGTTGMAQRNIMPKMSDFLDFRKYSSLNEKKYMKNWP